MRNLIIIPIIFSLIGCSQKLIKIDVIEGVNTEIINVKYLNNITKNNLQPNYTLKYGFDKYKDDFWLVNKTDKEQTIIYVDKTNNKIININRQHSIFESSLLTESNFYANGKLKNRKKSIQKTDSISNEYFPRIRFGHFLQEYLLVNQKSEIEEHFIFERDAELKLKNLINRLSKLNEFEGKKIDITTIYLIEDDKSSITKKLKKYHLYWSVLYLDSKNPSIQKISYFDGVSGELIEKVDLEIISAM